MKIIREKQLLQKKQLQEKAWIELRMKLRQEVRLAVMKVEEEARSDCKYEHPLFVEKELLKTDVDDDFLDDLEEGEIF